MKTQQGVPSQPSNLEAAEVRFLLLKIHSHIKLILSLILTLILVSVLKILFLVLSDNSPKPQHDIPIILILHPTNFKFLNIPEPYINNSPKPHYDPYPWIAS